ncbi:DUF1345 domain-containing protein [Sandarakinorhabdus sp.]|uniref:DUF1345 domain-containing protein n=1 Tax=Sandarakinorhabdus sp. TaxID=1916663 RepID=UPI00286DF25B|nr:DUF1345 domain-containing protein [Sandarakinorhabdus sp.]
MKALARFPHFLVFAGILALLWPMLLRHLSTDTALLLGFDVAVLGFLLTLARRMHRTPVGILRSRAAEPGHGVLRVIAMVVIAVVLVAVAKELGEGGRATGGLILAAGSLSMAWLFANSLFALHYMHLYYQPGTASGDRGGLVFPGDRKHPDFWDFCYFAFTIGMTFQVSDVVITATTVRRLVLLHSLLAFAFNIAVIALTVSLVASAIG